MAGDWTKIENATPDKPEIFRMAEILNTDPDAVLGKLLRFWIWAGDHTTDGVLTAPVALIDRLTHLPGFSAALCDVGWLQARSKGSFAIPQFTRHLGQSAKARASTNRRVAEHRERTKVLDPPKVAETSNDNVTEKPLPEKRREEKRRENTKPEGAASPAGDLADLAAVSILVFPCAGKPSEWRLDQPFVDELARLYPALDPLAECRLALGKIERGAVTKKTSRGMAKFLFAWMDRATNSQRPNSPSHDKRKAGFA